MTQFQNSPLFIIASERSGTNLLRKRITDAQGSYLGPSPAHLLKNLYYQEPYYGDLGEDKNFSRMVEDALGLCLKHFSPWEIAWGPESIVESIPCHERNAISLMHYMMNRYASEKGFEGYICKDNHLYEFAVDIAASIPGAKFIYLYRDPRDFVLSQLKRPNSIQSSARFAKLWSYEQTKAIAISKRLGQQGRCISLSYEDFISNEAKSIEAILSFLGVESDCGQKYVEQNKEEVHEWGNLSKKTMSENQKKYQKEMPRKQVALVEGICARQMTHLGYEAELPKVSPPSRKAVYADYLLGYLKRLFKKNENAGKQSIIEREKLLVKLSINYRSDI